MAKAKKSPIELTLFDKHVGSRIRMRRLELGLSQGKLGDALGLTFQQVQKYEKGTNRISAGRLWYLCKILDVGIAFFYDGAPDIGGPLDGMREPPSTAYMYDFLNTREGAALGQAFAQIKSGKARRAILDLAQECAAH